MMAKMFVHRVMLEFCRAEMLGTHGAATQLMARLASIWEAQEALWMKRAAMMWRAPRLAASLLEKAVLLTGAAAEATLEVATEAAV